MAIHAGPKHRRLRTNTYTAGRRYMRPARCCLRGSHREALRCAGAAGGIPLESAVRPCSRRHQSNVFVRSTTGRS
ncbi:hypothetical protein FKM82_026025 [Ascaphus truei]